MLLRGWARASLARTPLLAAPDRGPHWGPLPFGLRPHGGGPSIDGATGDLFMAFAKKELETSTFGLE